MRKLILAGLGCATIGVAALWADNRDDEWVSFVLSPFQDLYRLQQETGLDFGYSEGERYPGSGGGGKAAEVVLVLFDVNLICDTAYYGIVAFHGVAEGGRLSCALADMQDVEAAENAAQAVLEKFERSDQWQLNHDFRDDPRRPEAWGRTIGIAFDYVSSGGERLRVERIPLIGFTHKSGSYAGLDIGTDRRFLPTDLRLFVEFRFDSNCWSVLSAYEAVGKDSGAAQLEEYAAIKQFFDGRTYDEIPTPERVAAFADYLREECDSH